MNEKPLAHICCGVPCAWLFRRVASFSTSTALLPIPFVTDAFCFAARYVLRANRNAASGAAENAEAMARNNQSAKAGVRENTKLKPQSDKLKDTKTQRDRESFEKGFIVTENPPVVYGKQKTY
jgi:hypothetical protein